MSEEDDYDTIAKNNFNTIKELINNYPNPDTYINGHINDAYNELITNVYYAEYDNNTDYQSSCLGNLTSNDDLKANIKDSSDYDTAKNLIKNYIEEHDKCKKTTYNKKRTENLAQRKEPKEPNNDEYPFKPTFYTKESYVNTDEENTEEPGNSKSKKNTKLYIPKEHGNYLRRKQFSAETIKEREISREKNADKDMKNRKVLTPILDINKKNAKLMQDAKYRKEAIEKAREAQDRKAQDREAQINIPGGKTKKRRKNKSKRRRRRTLRANKSKKRPSKKGRKTRK